MPTTQTIDDTRPTLAIPVQPGAPRVAIIGYGFSGLCLAIHLLRDGIRSFRIYEKGDGVGGTWRDNTYPGAACDLASFAYCFSFEQKTDWSRKWSPQEEILEYMRGCADKYGLGAYACLGTEIAGARFDESDRLWRLRTAGGEEIEADVVVSGVGQLSRPAIPAIEGLDRFTGKVFHSARWDHDYHLPGRRVAVLGNAASAIQFIPPVARKVARLFVFQRSANWMAPRNDRAYTPSEKERFTRYPLLAKLYRWWIWILHELWFPVFRGNSTIGAIWERGAVRYMESIVADPELRRALVPDYPIGAKRILISDDYYQALVRDNVELVTEPIARLTEHAIVTASGRKIEVDAVILATGFRSTEFLAPIEVRGRRGVSLGEAWKDGPKAYYGMAASGFPNFFMMYGPNTNLGHNSIIFMIECQTGYIMQCIRRLRSDGLATLEIRADVVEAYDRRLQQELGRTAWAAVDHSWYKDASGRITNNWSGTTARYWWHTRRANPEDYEVETAAARPSAAEPARDKQSVATEAA